MQTLHQAVTEALEVPTSKGQVVPAPSGTPSVSVSNANGNWRSAEKKILLEALTKICALQKQYGKTPQELETLVEGFCWALGSYPMPLVLEAMRRYVMRSNDIPTPADIVNIIDPPKQELSGAVYLSIKKRAQAGAFIWDPKEKEYLRAFEAQEYAKVRGGSDLIREMNAQLALEHQEA